MVLVDGPRSNTLLLPQPCTLGMYSVTPKVYVLLYGTVMEQNQLIGSRKA